MSDQLSFDVALPHRRLDAERAAILDLIAGDPIHATDRAAVIDAILYAANHNAGRVDPNLVRARLSDPWGVLTVYPRVVGTVYRVLAAKGVIVPDGWVASSDRKGGNYGKPARLYRLVRSAVAA